MNYAVAPARSQRSTQERFWAKVVASGECRIWTGALSAGGYGVFGVAKGKNVVAHRWAYEQERGAVPAGLDIDHLCRTRSCVRVAHLEAVSRLENVTRGDRGAGKLRGKHAQSCTCRVHSWRKERRNDI